MSGWAATNTLRETLAIAWPEGDHAEPNVFTEALAALALVEAALDAAERIPTCDGFPTSDIPHPHLTYLSVPDAQALAAALRAVREGK